MEINKKVLAVLVLDASGSMERIKGKTISCINEYIQSLQPQGKACHMSLVTFSSNGIVAVCDNIPVKDVPKLSDTNYRTSGGTPLLDAVGKTIKEIQEGNNHSKEKPDVLFIVMTDGEENSSREYSQRQIIDLIGEMEKSGWTFVYLGANQDSWSNASRMGYASSRNVADYAATSMGVERAMAQTMHATQDYFSERGAYYIRQASLGKDINELSYSSKSFYGKQRNKKGGVKHGRYQ